MAIYHFFLNFYANGMSVYSLYISKSLNNLEDIIPAAY